MASLAIRDGALGKRLAAHLLRRTTYKYDPARIESFAAMTAEQAVTDLFTIPSLTHPEGPINYLDGTTAWLTTGPYEDNPGSGPGQRSVQFWFHHEMMTDVSIRHKMAFFFHAIFITAGDTDWRLFDHWRLFQLFALGNIKTLAKKVTLDNKMLRYLNNNINRRGSANENYAREFLELFTILKGPQIGTDNYTNYTEHDIAMAAKVLTGFTTDGFENKDLETGLATGQPNWNNHDRSNKKFSAAFDHQTILGATDETDMFRELDEFVDMVFGKRETARAFVRRLYRFFVSDRTSAEIENDIIEPLAEQLQTDGYEVTNTIQTLLKSVHFYDEDDSSNADEIIGGKLKSPLELYMAGINFFNANQMGLLNDTPDHYNNTARRYLYNSMRELGLPDYPQSVEGYPGFFKGPSYSRFWFDQTNIAYRYRVFEALNNGHSVRYTNNVPFEMDVVDFVVQNFTNLEYADELVTQVLEVCFPEMPDTDRYDYFKNKLLGSLSPINWFFEWKAYESSGDDADVRVGLETFFEAVITSPEYQAF